MNTLELKKFVKAKSLKQSLLYVVSIGLLLAADTLCAANKDLGTVAKGITDTFANITGLITGGCYVAGLAFAVTAILQFKQHKDNPTQITVGKPISLVFIAAALLFMPSVLSVAGYTMFAGDAKVASPSGSVFEVK